MGTIAEKLEHLETTKLLIKQAIIDKDVDVPASTPFREYAEKIGQIQSSGGANTFTLESFALTLIGYNVNITFTEYVN